jgi:exosortase A
MHLTLERFESTAFGKGCVIALAVLAPFLVYFTTARSLVDIWNSSDTFAHGYIILPITLWLLWRRRHALPIDAAAPYWPALPPLAVCGFGWLLAELANVQVVKQYAFVAMFPLIVLTVLGPHLARAMAFPMLFLLLAVPFGEMFISPLIGFTADFTVAALRATGIPLLRNGTHFDIPSGSWSVVEACSGVRYLISSFTLGCLYAYLTYRSRLRQALFVAASVVVPILANGLRAYLIVMIGHLSGMQLATGVDHLIYGWVFFGAVMFLMFWIGNRWREEPLAIITPPAGTHRAMRMGRIAAAAAACIVCVSIWPLYARYLDRAGDNPAPIMLDGFSSSWPETGPFTPWKPRFTPASAELHKYFRHEASQVGLSILYYRNARRDSQLISSVNRIVGEKDAAFRQVGGTIREEELAGRRLNVREAVLDGASGPILVWHWYWIGGTATISDYAGKLLQAKEKFLARGNDGAAVMLFAPYATKPEEARSAIRAYLEANLTAVDATLARNLNLQGGIR